MFQSNKDVKVGQLGPYFEPWKSNFKGKSVLEKKELIKPYLLQTWLWSKTFTDVESHTLDSYIFLSQLSEMSQNIPLK